MEIFGRGPHVAHGPDMGGASGGERQTESHEVVEQRLELVQRQRPELAVGDQAGTGDTSIAYNCHLEDAVEKILKVSKMPEGISTAEISALSKLGGIIGIPRLLEIFKENDIAVALLLEKVSGASVRNYVSSRKQGVADVFVKIRTIIEEVHKRGFLMPRDWLKEENWLVDETGQPYLLDLGELQTMEGAREGIEFGIKGDLRTFHTFAESYQGLMSKKDWKILEDLVYKDYIAYK